MISIVALLVVLALSILVTRIATVALTHTGLSRASAKFQARSAFTGVGFTTNASESVIDSTDGEARIIQGLITGIAFIGGGAILKDQDTVSGVSSAASIWNTGAIGLAVAFDRFEIAVLLAVLNVCTLFFFGRVKETVAPGEDDND